MARILLQVRGLFLNVDVSKSTHPQAGDMQGLTPTTIKFYVGDIDMYISTLEKSNT